MVGVDTVAAETSKQEYLNPSTSVVIIPTLSHRDCNKHITKGGEPDEMVLASNCITGQRQECTIRCPGDPWHLKLIWMLRSDDQARGTEHSPNCLSLPASPGRPVVVKSAAGLTITCWQVVSER